MNSDRIYHKLYGALRIVHWLLFFVVIEFAFAAAGYMIFGLLGFMLATAVTLMGGQDYSYQFLQSFPAAGRIMGLLCGVVCMRFVMARYTHRPGPVSTLLEDEKR